MSRQTLSNAVAVLRMSAIPAAAAWAAIASGCGGIVDDNAGLVFGKAAAFEGDKVKQSCLVEIPADLKGCTTPTTATDPCTWKADAGDKCVPSAFTATMKPKCGADKTLETPHFRITAPASAPYVAMINVNAPKNKASDEALNPDLLQLGLDEPGKAFDKVKDAVSVTTPLGVPKGQSGMFAVVPKDCTDGAKQLEEEVTFEISIALHKQRLIAPGEDPAPPPPSTASGFPMHIEEFDALWRYSNAEQNKGKVNFGFRVCTDEAIPAGKKVFVHLIADADPEKLGCDGGEFVGYEVTPLPAVGECSPTKAKSTNELTHAPKVNYKAAMRVMLADNDTACGADTPGASYPATDQYEVVKPEAPPEAPEAPPAPPARLVAKHIKIAHADGEDTAKIEVQVCNVGGTASTAADAKKVSVWVGGTNGSGTAAAETEFNKTLQPGSNKSGTWCQYTASMDASLSELDGSNKYPVYAFVEGGNKSVSKDLAVTEHYFDLGDGSGGATDPDSAQTFGLWVEQVKAPTVTDKSLVMGFKICSNKSKKEINDLLKDKKDAQGGKIKAEVALYHSKRVEACATDAKADTGFSPYSQGVIDFGNATNIKEDSTGGTKKYCLEVKELKKSGIKEGSKGVGWVLVDYKCQLSTSGLLSNPEGKPLTWGKDWELKEPKEESGDDDDDDDDSGTEDESDESEDEFEEEESTGCEDCRTTTTGTNANSGTLPVLLSLLGLFLHRRQRRR